MALGNNSGGDTLPVSIRGEDSGATHVVEPVDGRLVIDNPELLFLGKFEREGNDLSVSHDGETQLVVDYFGSDSPANLEAPNGAYLTAQTVNSLAGDPTAGQYAQSGGGGEPVPIGKVVKVEGVATSTTVAGVKNQLEVGAPVFQGDVIETGAGAKLGLSFVDKTVFSMSADARMVLDELIYDPGNAENSSMAFNLVQGAFVFVTGEIAPTGNMSIETPVATMGIRGTTPRILINALLGLTEFGILPDPGSEEVGSYVIFNKDTGQVIGNVTSVLDKWLVTSTTGLAVKIAKSGLDRLEDALALDEITDVFNLAISDRAELDGANSFERIAIDLSSDSGDQGGDDLSGDDGGTDSSTGVEDIPNQDDPPVAFDDSFATDDSSPIVADLNVILNDNGLGVDIDPEGFPILLTQINGRDLEYVNGEAKVVLPSGAIIKVTDEGQLIYFPNEAYNFLGLNDTDSDIFEYTIEDDGGQTDRGVITIDLTGRNQQPIILNIGSRDLSDVIVEGVDTGNGILIRSAAGQITFSDQDASDQHPSPVSNSVSATWDKSDGSSQSLGEVGNMALSLSESTPDLTPTLEFDILPPQFVDEPAVYGPLVDRPPSVEGVVDWTWTAGEMELDFLAFGEVLTVVYEVTITDDSGVGAGTEQADVTQLITVVLVGTNDGPTVSSIVNSTPSRFENDQSTTSGSFLVTDVDTTDVVSIYDVRVKTAEIDGDQATADPADLLNMFSPRSGDVVLSGDNTGTVSWDFDPNGETFDYLAAGQSLEITYAITLDDGNGGFVTQDIVVTINGLNDGPGTTDPIDVAQTMSESSALQTAGSFEVTDLDTDDEVAIVLDGVTVSTGGTDSDLATPDNDSLLAMFTPQSGTIVNDTSIMNVVYWNFNANGAVFDYLAVGEQLELTYEVVFADNSAAGAASSSQLISIIITGTNDLPIVTATTILNDTLVETDTTLTTSGTVSFEDADTSDEVEVDVSVIATGTTAGMTAGLDLDAMFSPSSQVVVASGDNTGTLNWTFNSGGEAFNHLAVGESLVLTYTLTFSDDSGSGDFTEDVTITINGTNDGPTIVGTPTGPQVRNEGSTATTVGTFEIEDLDFTDVVTVSQVNLVTSMGDTDEATPDHDTLLDMLSIRAGDLVIANGATSGIVNWTFNPDGLPLPAVSDPELFDYLAQNESLVLTYEVTVDDGNGGTFMQQIVITVQGVNDVPVADGVLGASLVSGTAALTEDGVLASMGSFGVTDLDTSNEVTIDNALVAVAVTGSYSGTETPGGVDLLAMFTPKSGTIINDKSTTGTVDWSFNAGNETFDYLAANQTVILTYTLPLTDGIAYAVPPTVEITITGTDDDPFVSAEVGSAQSTLESDVTTALNGAFTISDVDTADSISIGAVTDGTTVGSVLVSTSGASDLAEAPSDLALANMLTFAAPAVTDNSTEVNWTFASGAEAPFDYLAVGETLIITYDVPYSDNGVLDGSSPTHKIVVTVHGTNDEPMIDAAVAATVAGAVGEDDSPITAAGSFGVKDADKTDEVEIVEIVLATSGDDGYETTPGHTALLNMLSTTSPTAVSGTSTTGVVTWNFNAADGTFEYLGATDTLILNYTIIMQDGNGGQISQPVTITVNGADDAVQVSNATNSGLAFVETEGGLMTMGAFDVDDVDTSDEIAITGVSVATSPASLIEPAGFNALLLDMFSPNSGVEIPNYANSGTVNWMFNAGTDAFDFLADLEVLTVTYTVTLTGGVTETVQIEITGTNDEPFVSDVSGGVSAALSEASLVDSGSFEITDVDTSDEVMLEAISVTAEGAVGQTAPNGVPDDTALLGMFTAVPTVLPEAVNDTVNTGIVDWTFTGTNTLDAFEYLAAGEVLTLTYHVPFNDGNGGMGTQDIVITITGEDDGATAVATNDGSDSGDLASMLMEGGSLTTTGDIKFTDIDVSDEIAVTGVTVAQTGTVLATSVPSDIDDQLLSMLTLPIGTVVDDTSIMDTLNWSFNNGSQTFDFLGEGETLIATYTVNMSGIGPQTIQITITGENDDPVVSASVNEGDDAADAGRNLIESDTDTTGSFELTDLDISDEVTIGTVTAGASGVSGGLDGGLDLTTLLALTPTTGGTAVSDTATTGTVNWTFTLGDHFDYLADGETVTITYTVPFSDDSLPTAGTGSETITLTILGTNEGPMVGAGPDSATQSAGTAVLSQGSIAVTDGDFTDAVTVSEVTLVTSQFDGHAETPSHAALLAMFNINAGDTIVSNASTAGTIDWEFTPGTEMFDYLGPTDSLVLTYTVGLDDDNGGTTTKDIQITINGTNNGPVALADVLLTTDVTDLDGLAVYRSDAGGMLSDVTQVLDNDGSETFTAIGLVDLSLTGPKSNDVVLGDFDNDGDLDAFIGVYTDYGQILTNQGGIQGGTEGTFVTTEFLPGLQYGTLDVEIGDVNGDGFVDILISNWITAHPNQLLLNDQNGGFTVSILPGSVSQTREIRLGDLDGDGDLDAVVVHDIAANQILTNNGGVFSVSATLPNGNGHSADIGDVDGDGNLDIVVANWGGTNEVFFGKGAGGFLPIDQGLLDGGTRGSTSIRLGDLDGDGDLDAFVTNNGSGVAQADQILINQGGAQAGTEGDFVASDVAGTPQFSEAVTLVDIDHDGDLDAIVSNSLSGDQLLINDGTGVFTEAPLPTGIKMTRTIEFGDLDGDGDLPAVGADGLPLLVTGPIAGTAALHGSVASNDTDADANDTLTYVLDSPVDGLTFNADGSYSFDPSHAAYVSLSAGEVANIAATYTVTDSFGASAHSALTINVIGTNETPVVSNAIKVSHTFTESAAALIDSGTFQTSDADTNDTVSIDASTGITVVESGAITGLTLNNADLLSLLAPGTSIDGSGLVSWTFDNTAHTTAFDYLDSGEVLTLTYTVPFMDDSGAANGSGSQTVVISIEGVNDVLSFPPTSPYVSAIPNVTEAGNLDDGTVVPGTTVVNGTLAVTDPLLVAGTEVWTFNVPVTQYGSFTFDNSDGTWEYTIDNNDADTQALNEGGFGTESITATVTYDVQDPAAMEAFVINASDVSASGNLTEPSDEVPAGGSTFDGTFDDTGGTLVGNILTFVGTDGTLDLNVTDGSWTYTPSGTTGSDTFNLNYTYTSQNNVLGAVFQNVDVIGTNDAPEINVGTGVGFTEISGTVVEDPGSPSTITGNLGASDVDTGSSLIWTVDNGFGTYGNLTVDNSTLEWTYVLDNSNPTVDALTTGSPSLMDTFTVRVFDNNGASTTQLITVTINGADDEPTFNVLASDLSGSITEPNADAPIGEGVSGLTLTDTTNIMLANAQIETGDDSSANPNVVNGVVGSLLTYTPGGNFTSFGGSVYDSFNLNDGDANSAGGDGYHAIPNAGANSVILNFGAIPQTIGSIAIYNGYGNRTDGTYTLKDASGNVLGSWTISGTTGGTNDGVHSFWLVFDQPVTTTSLILDTTSTDTENTTNSYREIEVYGAAAPLTETGEISFSDPDTAATSFTVSSITPSSGALGQVTAVIDTANNEIDWTYAVQPEVIHHLALGETKVETFDIEIDNGTHTITETVTITLEGSNDAPTIVQAVSGTDNDVSETFAEAITLTTNGSFGVEDVDTADTVQITGVTVSTSGADGYAGTPAPADLLAMFSPQSGVEINDTTTTGVVDWNFNAAGNPFDYLANGDSLTITYTVALADGNGGQVTQDVVITIDGAEDGSTGPGVTGPLALTESEELLTAFGEFAVSDADTSDAISISSVSVAATLTPSGSVIASPAEATIETELGTMFSTQSSSVIGDTSNNGNGSWNFNSGHDAFDYLALGDVLTATYTITLSDGTTHQVILAITGTNDAPFVSSTTTIAGTLDETDALSAIGSFELTDVDLLDTVSTGAVTVVESGDTGGIPHTNGQLAAMLVVDVPGVIDNASTTGTVNWTFTGSSADAFDYLADGESLVLTYTIPFTDSQGASGSQEVVITINGVDNVATVVSVSNDGSNAGDAANLLMEDGTLTTLGDIEFEDIDVSDVIAVTGVSVVQTGTVSATSVPSDIDAQLLAMFTSDEGAIVNDSSTTGTLNWAFNNGAQTFDFLGEGETLIATYTINMSGIGPQTVQVTITGENDDPVVSASVNAGDDANDAGRNLIESDVNTTGSFDITDLDTSDEVTIGTVTAAPVVSAGLDAGLDLTSLLTLTPTTGGTAVGDTASSGTVNWTFALGNHFDYLADGETVTITYTVPFSDDSLPTAGTGSETLTFTIKGTNEAPEVDPGTTLTDISAPHTAGTDGLSGTTALAQGSVTINDVDYTDVVTVSEITLVTSDNDGNADTPSHADLLAMLNINAGDTIVPATATSGTIDWEFLPNGELFDYLGQGENLVLTYTIVLDDDNGGTTSQDITITIGGENNVPTVSPALIEVSFAESAGLQTTGSFDLADLDTTDEVTVTDVTVSATGNIGDGAAPTLGDLKDMFAPHTATIIDGSTNVGTVFWSFNANGRSFDYLAQNESIVITYSVEFEDDKGATGTKDVEITINGENNEPVVTSNTNPTPTLVETDATLITNGSISFADADTSDAVSITNVAVGATGTIAGLPAGLDLGAMFTPSTLTAVASGDNVDTVDWIFNSNGEAFNYLAVGESLVLTYTLTFSDPHSGPFTEDVVITINGTNDGPTISMEANQNLVRSEGDLVTVTDGSFKVTDLDFTDQVSISEVLVMTSDPDVGAPSVDNDPTTPNATDLLAMFSPTTGIQVGNTETESTVSWTFDPGTETFEYLADGESLFITYRVVLDDDNGGVVHKDILIQIQGTNDGPTVFAIDVDQMMFEGTVLQTVGSFELTDLDTTNEVRIDEVDVAIAAGSTTDIATPPLVDLDAMFVPQAGIIIDDASNVGIVNWSFNANGETFDYLAVGESLILEYTVNFTDNSLTPATGSQVVQITINGTNDLPVVTATTNPTPTLVETDATLITNGSISFADADTSDTVSITNVAVGATGTIAGLPAGLDLGAMFTPSTLTAVASGDNVDTVDWIFNSNGEAFNYLAVGESLVLTYTLTFSDDNGSGDFTQDIIITINGTNDGPTVDAVANAAPDRSEGVLTTTTGTIEVSDLDVSDVVSIDEVRLQTSSFDTTTPVPVEIPAVQDTPGTAALMAMFSPQSGDEILSGDTMGVINWTFDPNGETFEYLAVGESLVLTYTVEVEDMNGGMISQDIVVTINGTNNTPTVTATTDVSETMPETDDPLTTDGSFDIQDVDTTDVVSITNVAIAATGHTSEVPADVDLLAMFSPLAGVEIDGNNTNGTVNWAFNASTEAFDYLGVSDQLVLTYTLTIEDDNGASTTQDVVLTINGTNDSGTIAGDLAGAAATDSGIIVTGRVTVSDLDNPDNVFIADGGTTTFGSYTIDAAGNWAYTLNDSDPTVDALTLVSDAITDSFTVVSQDGTTETVEITISDDPMVGDSGNNLILGRINDDIILGGAGDDVLSGAAGNDLINGGAGTDTLQGDAGSDIFEFTDIGLGVDQVLDFEFSTDILDIDALLDGGGTAVVTENTAGGQVTGVQVAVDSGGGATTVANVTFASAVDSATFDSEALFASNSGAVTS